MKDVHALRREFNVGSLNDSEVPADPMVLFEAWFDHMVEKGDSEPNAMTLSTVSPDGKPTSRIVLLKDIVGRGFSFYTNYESEKGQHLAQNNHACLLFYWAQATRQIRIEGCVQKVARVKSEEYFATRPRGSQIGAWTSQQSAAISSGEDLANKHRETEQRFEGQAVPCPDHWGGYELIAEKIEFWQGRPNRLHDRFAYTYDEASSLWSHRRLQP